MNTDRKGSDLMAVDPGFVEYVCEQIGAAGRITSRMMFGGCAVYCDGKVVALVGDDRLYVKPTPGGRALAGDAAEASPYPGATPHLLIEDRLDDRDWMTALIRVTASELPPPRKKPRKKKPKEATASPIDEYVAGFPAATRKVLQELRALIRESAPGATEKMSYAIPTFSLKTNLVHFAGYERHVGFYPGASGVRAFREELAPYKTGKGSIRFPLDQPLPKDLIRRIVEFRVAENTVPAAAT